MSAAGAFGAGGAGGKDKEQAVASSVTSGRSSYKGRGCNDLKSSNVLGLDCKLHTFEIVKNFKLLF
jgi:hypothetical protein